MARPRSSGSVEAECASDAAIEFIARHEQEFCDFGIAAGNTAEVVVEHDGEETTVRVIGEMQPSYRTEVLKSR